MSWTKKLTTLMYGQPNEEEYEGEYDEIVEENDENTAEEQTAARPANQFGISSGSSIEMKVVKPEKLESVSQIADQLLARKTILLNLEETNKETSRRLIDFLNGVAYAISGTLKKVANNTYVITPSNVEVSGEQLHDTQDKTSDNI